ncbi:hypothetical protein [uncultured Tateyamaria sp.]|nr:hypothetical protein [uncultured Tateyamaria sp.]
MSVIIATAAATFTASTEANRCEKAVVTNSVFIKHFVFLFTQDGLF